MNRCSILAVRLHSTVGNMHQSKKYKWSEVMDAEWLKQTISVKEDTTFFENIIGITP